MKYYAVLYKVNHLGMEKHIRSDVYAASLLDAATAATPTKGEDWLAIMDRTSGVAYVVRQSNILSVQVAKMEDES